jgi:hypothetical protein
VSRQCGILTISQPYRPARPVTGIALLKNFLFKLSTHYKKKIFFALISSELSLSETKRHIRAVYLSQLISLKQIQQIAGIPTDGNFFLHKLCREWLYLERAHKNL